MRRLLRWPGLDWLAPLILMIVALALGWSFLPRHSAVKTEDFNLGVQPSGSLQEMSLTMTPSSATGKYDLKFALVRASAPVGLWFAFQPNVTTGCPRTIDVTSCQPATKASGNNLKLQVTPGAVVTIEVVTPVYPFSWNGETAEGWIPHIWCSPSCVGANGAATVFRVGYLVPDATSYNWTSGPPPQFTDGQPVWQQLASQLQEPLLAEGTDPNTQQNDEVRVFLSGISIGIAGALFAGSLQALIQWQRKRRPIDHAQ